MYELRQHEKILHDSTIEHYNKSTDGFIVFASVGTTKTLNIAFMAKHAAEKGDKVLVLSRSREIIEQNSICASEIGCDNLVFSAANSDQLNRCQVVMGTEGSVCRALNYELKDIKFNVILVDECQMLDEHDCMMDEPVTQYGKIMKHEKLLNPNVKIFGYASSKYRNGNNQLRWVNNV